ncbi:MAG: choice-of-anchor tandem repeat GloVer-containing protein [Rhodospirillales bacterium]
MVRAQRSPTPTFAYGTTFIGGTADKGTIFRINLETNKAARLYSFTGGEDGAYPNGKLTYGANGDFLYGATINGGSAACKCGTVFQFKL